jgi:hypothetical protein
MEKRCKICDCVLTLENRVKTYKKKYESFRGECKWCRSKAVVKYQARDPLKRRIYANEYKRKIGKVREYPCETCAKPCYKKYAKAFCSDKCRFVSYVDKSGDCWIWKGGLARRGYGKFMMGDKTMIASRVAYELFIGPIKDDNMVCHSCDNSPCVNWKHLWQGTNSDNQQDSIKKGRRGHQRAKLIPERK